MYTRRKNMRFSLSLFSTCCCKRGWRCSRLYIYIYICFFFLSFFFLSFLYVLRLFLFFFFLIVVIVVAATLFGRHAWMRCKMHLMAEETDRPFNAYVNSCFTVFRVLARLLVDKSYISCHSIMENERERERKGIESINFRKSRIETATIRTKSISVDTGNVCPFGFREKLNAFCKPLNLPSHDSFYPI